MEGLIIGGIFALIIAGLIAIWPDIEDVIDDLNDQGRD